MLGSGAGRGATRLLAWSCALVALVVITLSTSVAHAYPWMIRHEYAGCVPCHADPSGASGVLTEYGRAQSDNILRMRYGKPVGEEASTTARFLWGVPTPDWLLLGGSIRDGWMTQKAGSNGFTLGADKGLLDMQADLKAQITLSRFRAYGSLGFEHEQLYGTYNITHATENNLVSREHWLGVDLGEDKQFLLRAGRINTPFGIRIPEHTMWVRSETRSDFNGGQQDGIALAYTGSKWRAEGLAILGNYQINPDVYRERGFSGYVEWAPAGWAAVGASALVTYARQDYQTSAEHVIRQAHGVFARLAPAKPLAILAEADLLVRLQDDTAATGTRVSKVGMASLVQADVEPTQGLHFSVSGEFLTNGVEADGPSGAAWVSAVWFFAPHADLRFDFIEANTSVAGARTNTITLLPQIHLFL